MHMRPFKMNFFLTILFIDYATMINYSFEKARRNLAELLPVPKRLLRTCDLTYDELEAQIIERYKALCGTPKGIVMLRLHLNLLHACQLHSLQRQKHSVNYQTFCVARSSQLILSSFPVFSSFVPGILALETWFFNFQSISCVFNEYNFSRRLHLKDFSCSNAVPVEVNNIILQLYANSRTITDLRKSFLSSS